MYISCEHLLYINFWWFDNVDNVHTSCKSVFDVILQSTFVYKQRFHAAYLLRRSDWSKLVNRCCGIHGLGPESNQSILINLSRPTGVIPVNLTTIFVNCTLEEK